MRNSLSPVSGRILCTATAEVLSGSQVKTTPPIVNSQLVFHTPILFDMKFFISLPMGNPLNIRPLRKKMLVFYCFFYACLCWDLEKQEWFTMETFFFWLR